MNVLSIRVPPKLLALVKAAAQRQKIPVSQLVRHAIKQQLTTDAQELQQLSNEAMIEHLVKQLDFLDHTQRKMLRSGAFLAMQLPKDWSRAKRWSYAVKGEEREALERLLAEREYIAKQIAKLAKTTYSRSIKIVLLDRKPWYQIKTDDNDKKS
jgi:hypothetical protein